jgi:hypothetical protein
MNTRFYGEMRNEYKILDGKTEGKRLVRPRRRGDDNIRTDLKETVLEGVDWMQLAGPCEHGNEPSSSINVGNCLTS